MERFGWENFAKVNEPVETGVKRISFGNSPVQFRHLTILTFLGLEPQQIVLACGQIVGGHCKKPALLLVLRSCDKQDQQQV